MNKYAKGTQVAVARSKIELDSILVRYGATRRAIAEEQGRAVVTFECASRCVQIELFLPHPDNAEFRRKRSYGDRLMGELDEKKHEQACREKWRALVLILKAKLEAVRSGITTFETEFMAHLVLSSGGTVGARIRPQLAEVYKTGRTLPLLVEGKRS